MFVSLAIHRPKSGQEKYLIESMRRFRRIMLESPGVISVNALQDKEAGVLVGLAIWDSEESRNAVIEEVRKAIAEDPFGDWEDSPPEMYALTEARVE
ncbi:MAG: hypothetical protein GY841_19345 [FCB group bacterium]|nr:hypothetical protein [FCB group bacterium]